MPPTPLPNDQPFNSKNPTARGAYEKCLQVEHANLGDPKATHKATAKEGPGPLLSSRLLGYLLRDCLTDAARATLSQEIVSCENEDEFCDLAEHFLHHFVRCCTLLLVDSKNDNTN